jgi:hypothetical protein
MKRISFSARSEGKVRRFRSEVIRNVCFLNLNQFEDALDVFISSESEQEEFGVHNAPLLEIQSNNNVDSNNSVTHEYVLSNVDNAVDRGSCIIDRSDSESSDDFVKYNEIDDSLVQIEQQRPQTFKDMLASWTVNCGVPHVHVNKLLSIL